MKTWLLIFVLLSGNHERLIDAKQVLDNTLFATEAECKTIQQELFNDKEFVTKVMFGPDYIVIPTCVNVKDIRPIR